MLPNAELPAEFQECSACVYQYELWSHIIESCKNASYGRRALAALDLDDFIKDFKPDMRDIDAASWRDVKAVRSERARLDAQRTYNQEEEAKRNRVK